MAQGDICNYDDLYILLGRMSTEERRQFEPLVQCPDGVYRIVSLTTDYEGLPDWCVDGHPSLVVEN